MNGPEEGNRELESELWLNRLEKLANHKAAASENIADLERAASAAALIANARKSRDDLKRNTFRLRLDEAKSWAFLAIPFLIFVGLMVFLPRPNQQARVTREASADTQFREVERTFIAQVTQTGALARPDLMLLTTPLQPYLQDSKYAREATDLSLLALSHTTSSDAFQDYFVSRNIRVNAQTLTPLLTLDRTLYTNFNELDEALNSDATANASTVVGRPLNKDQAQKVRDAMLVELTYLSAKIASYLRTVSPAPLNTDLRRVYFKSIDLSNAVFGKSALDSCQWEGVLLAGVDLSSVIEFDNSQWIDANWWDARSISKPLLNYLIANQYPYHPPVVEYTAAPSSREAYEQKVTALCRQARLSCDVSKMPYGTPSKNDKHSKTAATSE